MGDEKVSQKAGARGSAVVTGDRIHLSFNLRGREINIQH